MPKRQWIVPALFLSALLFVLLAACTTGAQNGSNITASPSLPANPTPAANSLPQASPSEAPKNTGTLSGDPDSIKYELKDYTLYLPSYWIGLYTVCLSENGASFYSTKNMKTDCGGFVFSIVCTDDDLSEGDARFLDFAHGKYLWLSEPHDVQFDDQDQQLKEEYDVMRNDIDEIAENIVINPEENSKYTYETESFETKHVNIYYPHFTDLGSAQDSINILVRDTAFHCAEDINGEKGADWIQIRYRVKYNRGGLISVVFDGRCCTGEDQSHFFLYTLNIDVQKQKVIKLSDMITVQGSLIDVIKSGTYDSTDHWTDEDAFGKILNAKDWDTWMGELSGADSLDPAFTSSYFTEDALVLSLPGNEKIYHVEAIIPYSKLTEFRTGSDVWDIIDSFPAPAPSGKINPEDLKNWEDDMDHFAKLPVSMDFDGDGQEETLSAVTAPDNPDLSSYHITLKIDSSETMIFDSYTEAVSVYITDFDENYPGLDICVLLRNEDSASFLCLVRYDGKQIYQYDGYRLDNGASFYYDGKGKLYFEGADGLKSSLLPIEG